MLGELGGYPLLVKSLVHTLKYKWNILNSVKRESSSLVSEAVSEMRNMGIDNWMSRVSQVEKLLNISIKPNLKTSESVGKYLKQKLH